jgi:rhamnopyranosyl-N-acetylglucosaminyl-diphospho-decaprenol beta-1,3/1,4-galactofuranosyltransferase
VRVLAHIHTFNDSAVIENLLEGLRRQTRQPDAIIVVDNASTDDTLDRVFPPNVTIVRNSVNTGSCGGVHIGLAYGLDQGFDWTWVFDADSVPEPDALENLLAFYEGLTAAEQERICFLASNMATATGVPKDQPMIFTNSGIEYVPFNSAAPAIKADFFIWSGLLFRMGAVREIGLPSRDYVIDFGELEYGYRAKQLGFESYMVKGSRVGPLGLAPLHSVILNFRRYGPTTGCAICSTFGCMNVGRCGSDGLFAVSAADYFFPETSHSDRSATGTI